MPLVDIWKTDPEQIRQKAVQQLLSFAGDGRLRDESDTSSEFRDLLRHLPSELLTVFANQCLDDSFPQSGFALQDIINEIGRRLGFKVQEGRYRGIQGAVGFDGLWRTSDKHTLLIEVKTTDAYRLSLDTTANYRKQLIQDGDLSEELSSILYVVGRSDTGDLEAQVRGSRHAWDIRLISVDALLRLLKIKEDLGDPTTIDRIRDILTPREFTRVDSIIDLVFTTAKDIKQEVIEIEETEEVPPRPREKAFTPVNYRDACITRLQSYIGQTLVKQSFAIFATPDENLALLCAISREYTRGRIGYWFAFHPGQKDTLGKYPKALVSFGCGSPARILVFPFERFVEWLPQMNKTELEDRFYWHRISGAPGKHSRLKQSENFKMSMYRNTSFRECGPDPSRYMCAIVSRQRDLLALCVTVFPPQHY